MKLARDFDWLLLLMAVLLCVMGFMLIYSVFQVAGEDGAEHPSSVLFKKQLLWFCFGVIAMLAGFSIHFRYFEALAFISYALALLLLIAAALFNKGSQTQRWLILGPVQIQPSEFAKVALLFAWARVLTGHKGGSHRFHHLMVVILLFLAPFLLVLKGPDLGTAIILFVLMLAVLYWRGFKVLYIFYLMSPVITCVLIVYGEQVIDSAWPLGIYIVMLFIIAYAAYARRASLIESIALVAGNLAIGIAFPAVWDSLKQYQQNRIMNFLDPGSDKLGAGWQVIQSKIAIGSGGIAGKGYLEGTQKALEFIPAQHTDFIFSVLGEEIGFIGAAVMLLLFSVLIYRAIGIAVKAKSEFASTVCLGIAVYFFIHVFINISMTTGMAPVTGIPLPFLSYGGSSLVVSMFMTGVLLNCSVRWFEY
ncbi:MAG: rod shape-determining protein RodA [Chitinivibrionia bacterium]|nr:rod shape-determining protein RodA [Chitinivibrionia bacterium]